MSTVKQFEDLIIWQDSRKLVQSAYSTFGELKDYGFRDQILRASVSVMNNIAEGFERDSNKEFIRFLYIAKASCGEVRSMLYIASDLKIDTDENIEELHKLSRKISIAIQKMINYLKQN